MRQKNIFLLVSVLLTSVACSSTLPSFKSYKLDIQQGNVVTSKMMDQVRPGMTKSQVRYVLGTPLIQDSFHKDRWDYLYQYRHEGNLTQQNRVILFFKDDLLANIAGDPVPEGTLDPASVPKSDIMLERADKRTFVEKLKFWNSPPPSQAELAKAELEKAATKSVEAAKQAPAPKVADKVEVAKAEAPASVQAEENATSSLLAIPIEAVAVAGIVSATDPATNMDSKVTAEQATSQPIEEKPVEQTSIQQATVEQAPVVAAMTEQASNEVALASQEAAKNPEPVPVVIAVEAPSVALPAEAAANQSAVAQTDEDNQPFNPELEQPILLLDKKLKQLSDKPIAKINATPDLPPKLILSRSLASAPEMHVPVREVPVKPESKAKVIMPQTDNAPSVFERMLEKMGF